MRTGRHGFTLLEIMIVVAIIGLLAAIAIPSFRKARETTRINVAKNDLRLIADAVGQLAFDTGRWPGGMFAGDQTSPETWDLTGGAAGIVSNDGRFPHWRGPYLNQVGNDPWGHPYFFDNDYETGARKLVVVGSFGPNGQGRNLYDSDDVYVRVQ